MMIWVIADTHWNHPKLVSFGRPADFTERILANWKRLVKPGDLVIHLGDVIIQRASELPTMVAGLPGVPVLVLGNHDDHSPEWYMSRGFAFACHRFEMGKLLFSHEPTMPLPQHIELNLHGHFHTEDSPKAEWYRSSPNSYFNTHRDLYTLVSIEKDLSPIPLDQIVGDHRKALRVKSGTGAVQGV